MSERERLPDRRGGMRLTLGRGSNKIVLSTGEYPDGRLGEIFLDHQREGTFGRDMMQAFAIALSIGLQHGVPLATYNATFRDFRMDGDFIQLVFEELERWYVKSSDGS